MMTSRPIGSLNWVTRTSAPAARAALMASSKSVTRYPVRSAPKGYGMGVLKPKTETVPAGVNTSWDIALLGVGVWVNTPCLVVVPPNVARKLETKRSNWSGATRTCVVSYWGPTATFGSVAVVSAGTDTVFCEVDRVPPAAKGTIPRRAALNTWFLCIAKLLLKSARRVFETPADALQSV